jgi:hypothetical protein
LGDRKVPVLESRLVRDIERVVGPDFENAGFEFDQAGFEELRATDGSFVDAGLGLTLSEISVEGTGSPRLEIDEFSPGLPVTRPVLGGVVGQNDSDDDDDGDTDRESDDDEGDDSDNRHDSEPDEDAVAREGGLTLPFDINRLTPPFAPRRLAEASGEAAPPPEPE